MNLSAPFVARPVATSLLAVALVLLGLLALSRLPVSALPRVDIPTVVVTASQPGASPETMSRTVAAPLERRLGTVPGVTEMTSSSSLGTTTVVLQFELSRRQRDAARDVQAAVNAARPDLPSGLPSPPAVRRFNPGDVPVLVLALTSDTLAGTALYDVADSLVAQRLAQVPGVGQVSVSGGDQPAVRVAVDPAAAAAAGVTQEAARRAIQAANTTRPLGAVEGPLQSGALWSDGRLTRASEYAGVVVRSTSVATVRLGDVATVRDGTRSRRQAASFDGRPAILLNVSKTAEANVLGVVDGVRAVLPEILAWAPAGVGLHVVTDRSATIRASVSEVWHTLALTAALVVGVVALFLRRAAPVLAAAISVPLSLLGTLVVIWWLGYSLNNLSLMALIVSIGFVVDDAIVMIENMSRHRERGLSPLAAALEGSREIGFTILAITLALVATLLPLLAMGGIVGRFFREFSVTLAVAVAFSGLVSLTVTPMMAGRLGRAVPRPSGALSLAAEAALASTARAYLRSLAALLRHRGILLLGLLGLVAATVWLFVAVPKGFLPTQDTGLIGGNTQAASDADFATMLAKVERVVEIIRSDPDVVSVAATAGSGGGQGLAVRGSLWISLRPLADGRAGVPEVIERLRPALNAIPGAAVFLRAQEDLNVGGRRGGGRFSHVLLADDLDEMRRWSQILVDALRGVPGLHDVSSDQDRAGLVTRVEMDRDAAARLGVEPAAVSAALNSGFSQRQVSTIYAARNQYRVVLEVDPSLQAGPEGLSRVFVPGRGGVSVPLSAVARVVADAAPLSVTHQGGFPSASIGFNLDESTTIAEARARIEEAERAVMLPASIRTQPGGNAAQAVAFARDMPALLIGAVFAVYLVLGVLYESTVHPLTILSTVPSSGLGALLALWWTGTPLGLTAMVGLVLIVGIVLKNGILMVDFALDHERRHGASPEEAILAACRERFRPILMTTMAAVFGALPLAFATGTGSELRVPLGVAILGGLAASQVLTLYTTPAVYLALDRLRRRRAPRLLPAQ